MMHQMFAVGRQTSLAPAAVWMEAQRCHTRAAQTCVCIKATLYHHRCRVCHTKVSEVDPSDQRRLSEMRCCDLFQCLQTCPVFTEISECFIDVVNHR